MIIRHRSFSFSKPNFPTEEKYVELRKKFRNNPNAQIFPTQKFWNYFGREIKKGVLIPLMIAIVSGILFEITRFELFEVLFTILGLYLVVKIFLYGIWEWGSFLKSNYDKKIYTKKLMKKILNSHSYYDFRENNKFWMRMHPKY